MSLKRSMKRRKKNADIKAAKNKTQEILGELASMPDACHRCDASFDPKSDFCLDNWVVNVSDTGIRMLCDMCKVEG